MLVHRGRRTGHLHRTVLEVVRFDPGTGESIVAVAYGLSADWYRNILAGPALAIYTGRDSYTPAQRFLTVDQVEAELADYERRYPRLLRVLLRMIGIEYDGTARGRRALAAHLPMVAFRPPEPGQAR
jgi:deazaflavin-dependent oxidoreductase (nitroreductase family)